mmetsp:Transcript_353/g.1082  ORF Transcript_353/g.1082 Transcript_353/m.1082 type:complete len:93 (-) Transcript_353:430-708(-)
MPTRRSTGAYLSAFLLSAALFRMHIDEEAGHRALSAAVTLAAAAVVMYAAFFALSMYFVATKLPHAADNISSPPPRRREVTAQRLPSCGISH